MNEPDNQLIADFNARRCESAFAGLVRQHVDLVFGTAMRQVGDRAAAEEITQNVFIALAQSAGKLGSHPTIAGWLHRTTLNKSREWLRAEFRRQHREQKAADLAVAGGDSVWAPLVPLLDDALLQLRDHDRAAVVLHFIEGRTFQEVGATLGIGEDTARKRVDRCLEQLTKFFQRQGFTMPALSVATPLFALALHTSPAGLAASVVSAALKAPIVPTISLATAVGTIRKTFLVTTLVGVGVISALGPGFFSHTKYYPIDLTNYYQRTAAAIGDNDTWSAAPWGRQDFDSVPFELGGVVEVTGLGPARTADTRFSPPGIGVIPVNHKVDVLHIIHGVHYAAADGTPIAELVLHYADGEKRAIAIQYGVHSRNWWQYATEHRRLIKDHDSNVCWTGDHPAAEQQNATLRLYHSRFRNPLPNQTVTGIEFNSLFSRAGPVLLAITVSTGDADSVAPAATNLFDASAFRAEAEVETADAASKNTITNATIRLQVFEPKPVLATGGGPDTKTNYFFGEYRTDDRGTAALAVPKQTVKLITVDVTAPGYTPKECQFPIEEFRGRLTVEMAPETKAP